MNLELRITKGFGTRAYDQVRISVISTSASPPVGGFFDYSAQFKYKWTQNYLHTSVKNVIPGMATMINVGTNISVRLPKQGVGTSGFLMADPCVNPILGIQYLECDLGDHFDTLNRTPALINAFVGGIGGTDFWSILGDNFYDRSGEMTAEVFSRISLEAKSKFLITVPGNHDYWIFGAPDAGTREDQCGYGHMQYYPMDTKAAEATAQDSAGAPYNFTIDPDAGHAHAYGCNLPALENSFWYHQIGNMGLVGQSGAYSLHETRPFMLEACAWLARQPGLDVAILFGHWDDGGVGADDSMAMPQWYSEMAVLPGCDTFKNRGMLKYVMGHTHCNDPHPHGDVGAGFRVAGFGLAECTEVRGHPDYGVPIVDTTEGRVRVWYFDASSDDLYHGLLECVNQKGWRQCTSFATLWLDEPLVSAVTPSRQEVV